MKRMRKRRPGVRLATLFLAAVFCLSFPAYAAPVIPLPVEMEDGEYEIGVTLTGGSGRASVTSPATLIVAEGLAYARIEWSSSHYDYMRIGEETFLPVNSGGNSVFEIPVTVFDEPMNVIADTTAMSVPHEVEYAIIFDSSDLVSQEQTAREQETVQVIVLVIVAAAAACVAVLVFVKRSRKG